MLTAFQIITLVFLVVSGMGSIADKANRKGYLQAYGVSGVLFLLSAIIGIFY